LIADIGLNVAMLRADVGRANAELSRGTALMNRSLAGLQKQVSMVGAGFRMLAGGAALGLLANKVRSVVQEVDGLAKAAKTAGVSAESLQELRFAFGQIADVTDDLVDNALQRFVTRIGDAALGNKEYAETFAALGVSLTDASGKMRSTEEILDSSLEALGKIENDAVRASEAAELFGDRIGPKLAQALKGGTGELEHMRQEAHKLGIVLSDDLVARAEELQDQFDVLSRVIGVQFQSLILENAETIHTLADAFMKLANMVFDATGKITDFATEFAKAAGEMAGGALGFGSEADVLEKRLAERQTLRNAIEANMKRSRGGSINLGRSRLQRETMGEVKARFGTFVITQEQAQQIIADLDAEIAQLKQEQLDVLTSPKATANDISRGQGLRPQLDTFIDQLKRGEELEDQRKRGEGLEKAMRTDLEKWIDQWNEATELFAAGAISEETLHRVSESLLKPIEVTAKRMPQRELIDQRKRGEELEKEMRTDRERRIDQLNEAKELFAVGAISEETLRRVSESLNRMSDEWERLGKSMGNALEDSLAAAMLGVETNWKDMIKRMIAQAAASGILSVIGSAATGPLGKVFSFLGFGGNRAQGGPLEPGKWYIAGEKGPEPVWGGGPGAFAAGYPGGVSVYIGDTHIDARGATTDLVQRLPKILDDHRQRTKAEIADLIRRNRFATV
jgi:hypothetical protein